MGSEVHQDESFNDQGKYQLTERIMETINMKLKRMKWLLLFGVLIAMISMNEGNAQPAWHRIGADISTAGGYNTGAAISVSLNGEPVIANIDRVRRFNPIANDWLWVLNNPITEPGDNQVLQHFRAFASPDNENHVYFSFFRNGKAYAHRLNLIDNSWAMLGGASLGATFNFQRGTSIVAGNQGKVYVAFINADENGHISVKEYNPVTDSWNFLGGVTVANATDQTIDLLQDGTPILMYRENHQNVIKTYNQNSNSWDLFPQIPLNHLDQPQIVVSPIGTIFTVTSAGNNPINISDYLFIVHRWDAENEEWITMNGTPKPDFFGANTSREGSLKMVVGEDDIPFIKQIIDTDLVYGITQVSKWNPLTEMWEFTHPCDNSLDCGINNTEHNATFTNDIAVTSKGDIWLMYMNGPSGNPTYGISRWGCEDQFFGSPELYSPLNNSGPYSTAIIPLAWSALEPDCFNNHPDGYTLEVYDHPEMNPANRVFNQVLILDDVEEVNGNLVYQFNQLLPNKTYYWRVKANGSLNWSNTWSFSTANELNQFSLWDAVTPPEASINLRSVYAISEMEFYVGSDDGRVFYTQNGGGNYSLLQLNPQVNGAINDINFIFNNRLVLATESGTYFAIVNEEGRFEVFNRVSDIPSRKVFAEWNFGNNLGQETPQGYIIQSNDSLLTAPIHNHERWSAWSIRRWGFEAIPNVYAIDFHTIRPEMGYLLGSPYNGGTGMWFTDFAGRNWHSRHTHNGQPTITNGPAITFYGLNKTMLPGEEIFFAVGDRKSVV